MVPYGIGRGFDRSRTNGWYIRVRGRKEYFVSEELRDHEYDRRIAEAKLYGEAASANVTPAHRQLLQEIQRQAQVTGYTPMEIFERGLTLVGVKPRTTISAAEAIDSLIEDSRRRLNEGMLRKRHFSGQKAILTKFRARFANRELHSISRGDVAAYIADLGVGPQTRINHQRIISRLFSWANDAIGHIENPVVITDEVKRTPAIFRVAAVERMVGLVQKSHAELAPLIALQWWAGIRPAATQQMKWQDINREARTVVIRPEISKLGEPEVIEHLPDEFWAWVDRQPKLRGRIAPANHVKMAKALHHEAGFRGRGKKRWPTDVARHTFASHLYPRLRSIDAVAKILCHRGSRVTLKHYVAKNVTEAESAAYFKLLDGVP